MKNCIVLNTFDIIFNYIGIKKPIYKLIKPTMSLPAEKLSTVTFGIIAHLFPAIFFIILVSISSLNLWKIFGGFILISILTLSLISWIEHRCPSVPLPCLTRKDKIQGLFLVFFTATLIGTLFIVSSVTLARMLCGFLPALSCFSWYSIAFTVLFADFSYYWIHRALSHSQKRNTFITWFRKNHAPHHSVKALDFYRGNLSTFFDTAIASFQVPIIFMSLVLGLHWQEAIVAYFLVLLLQSTHHVNYTFHLGFMRYIFVDNHSHKLHHCPKGFAVNFGAVFAIWDIFFRTYYEDWSLSSSYLAKHRIAIPIKKIN